MEMQTAQRSEQSAAAGRVGFLVEPGDEAVHDGGLVHAHEGEQCAGTLRIGGVGFVHDSETGVPGFELGKGAVSSVGDDGIHVAE